VALTALLALGLAQDAGHWRLPRSNPDVAFARRVIASVPADARIGIEQAWRLGGRLYLHPREIVDLDPDRLGDGDYLFANVPPRTVLLLDSRSVGRHNLAEPLRNHGYAPAPLAVRGSRYQMWVPATPGAALLPAVPTLPSCVNTRLPAATGGQPALPSFVAAFCRTVA
jgi:hypothetical protein